MPSVLLSRVSLIWHNANVGSMLGELFLSRLTVGDNQYHALVLIMGASWYLAFSWEWYRRHGLFYYAFIDFNRRGAPLAYVGLLLAAYAAHRAAAAISAGFHAGDQGQ